MKTLSELLATRKSVRSFRDESVSREVIEDIVRAGIAAPSNCNQQLWNFIVLDDAAVKERLIREAASNTLIRRAPIAIVVTYDGWNEKEAIQGASLAVGYMLLRAHDLGLGALPMNSYGRDKGVRQVLGIPEHERICCFVLIGYPDERAIAQPQVVRRPVSQVLHYNVWRERERPSFALNPELWTLDTLGMHQQYYCRKTFLGKEMDIMSRGEREIVRRTLDNKRGAIVDYMSYDGSLLCEFPKIPVTTLDTTNEVAQYTATARQGVEGESLVLFEQPTPSCETATLIFKAERLSCKSFQEIADDAYGALKNGGEFIVISRKHNIFFTPFFILVRLFFGFDTRRTGIFTWFGPYRLVSRRRLLRDLERAGFLVSWSGYEILPSFFERVYQMIVQYVRSGGSSYLHREERDDWIARSLRWVGEAQAMRRFGIFGGIIVIRAKK